MGARASKQSKYSAVISTIPPEQIQVIKHLMNNVNIRFYSYNDKFIQNIIAVRQSLCFNAKLLRILRKYSKQIKVFVDSHTVHHQQEFDEICQMESLEQLKIKLGVEVKAKEAIKQLTRLKNLKALYLDDMVMTYEELVELTELFPDLESLSINFFEMQLPEAVLGGVLQNMKSLKELIIENSECVQQNILNSIVKSLPGLTKLKFQLCHFKDKTVWKILQNLVSLKSLYFALHILIEKHQFFDNLPVIPSLQFFYSSQISQYFDIQNLALFAQKYPNLKEANFCYTYGISDEFLARVAELWKDLRVVNLSSDGRDRQITGTGIEVLVKNHPNIHFLNISSIHKIGDRSVITISALQELKELKIGDCQLSNKGIIYFGKLKKLERLDVSRNHLTNNVVIKILKSLKLFDFQLWEHEERWKALPKKQKKQNLHEISYVRFLLY